MLKIEFSQHVSHDFRGQNGIWKRESSIVPRNDHFSKLSSWETFCSFCYFIYNIFIYTLHLNQFFTMIKTSWIFPDKFSLFHWGLWWLTILDQVMEKHNSSFIFIWFIKADYFIDTIVDSFIQLFWVVSGHN